MCKGLAQSQGFRQGGILERWCFGGRASLCAKGSANEEQGYTATTDIDYVEVALVVDATGASAGDRYAIASSTMAQPLNAATLR